MEAETGVIAATPCTVEPEAPLLRSLAAPPCFQAVEVVEEAMASATVVVEEEVEVEVQGLVLALVAAAAPEEVVVEVTSLPTRRPPCRI